MIRLALLLWFAATPAHAVEEIVADLSQSRVAITTTFSGSEILVFGAVKRRAPVVADAPLEVIVTVAGPEAPVVVRRKARVAGIWANAEAVTVDSAPSFYAVAT
ncbi:MAG: TIGR02186 family protein, partial [Shimia sp.]